MPTRATRTLFAVCVTVLIFAQGARGEDFRVESQLYLDKETQRSDSSNVTLFQAGKVYDYLTRTSGNGKSDTQVSVFDVVKGRFSLLDPNRKVQADITRDRLVELNGSLREHCAGQTDALIKFSAEPKFTETATQGADETTFSSPVMSYRVLYFMPASAEAAGQYRDFTDAFARLNSVTNPGSMPPFPRLAVNEALGKKDAIPREVERTIIPRNKLLGKPIIHRTTHTFQWRLEDGDRDRINETRKWQVEFTQVPMAEFLPAPKK